MNFFSKDTPLTNKSYFKVIFALFLVSQLLSLTMNMVMSLSLRNWLAEDAKSYNKSVIESLETTMNSMLTEITRLVQASSIAADNTEQLNDYEHFTPEDYLLVRKIAKDLSLVMGSKQSISSWFYYYPEKHLVIADGNVYHSVSYFTKYKVYENLQWENMQEAIDSSGQLLLNLNKQNSWSITNQFTSRSVIPFVTSYQNLIRQKAMMVVNIQSSDIYNQTLHYRTSDQMGMLIADSEGHPIVSWGLLQEAKLMPDTLPQVESGEYLLTEHRLNKTPTVFLSSGCTFPDWSIHVAYSKSSFYQKSNVTFWTMTAFNLIVTMFGIGLSYLFSRRIFSPIYNLTQILYPNTPKTNLRRNEIHLISTRMEEIQQKNLLLQENLQTILPCIKKYHLRELLTQPNYLSEPENLDFLEHKFLLPPDKGFLLCRVLIRYRSEFLAQFSSEQQERQCNDVIEVLHTLMQNVCRRTERIDLSPDQTFFLFSLATFSEKEQADFSKNLHLFLQDVLRLFSHDAENIRVHFVVSNPIPSARDLASAYSELNLFSQRIIGADDESAVIDIPPILPPPPPEIPQEQAEKLRNLLLMGDLDGLERLFPELFEKNICTLEQADQHYHWLFSHIEALFQELHQDSAPLMPYAGFCAPSAFSSAELHQAAAALVRTAAELLQKHKPSHFHIFQTFIEENYADCSLSAETAAAAFQTLPSAFSRRFKEEYGVSFPKYLIQFRISRAKELLLTTPMTVDEIAEAVGINNRSTFNRLFNQMEGIPPGKYRTLYRKFPEKSSDSDV